MEDSFITTVCIEKVRHLSNITIELSKEKIKHLILTGKNGSGKTSVLNAVRDFLREPLERNIMPYYYKGVKVVFNLEENVFRKLFRGGIIFAYFDAKRFLRADMPNSIEKVNLQEKYDIDNSPAPIFIKYLVNLKTQQAFARNENDTQEVERLDKWFQNFIQSLRELFEDDSLRLKFDYKSYNFTIHQQGKEPFGFETLSDGYSAFLNIITDLILRMENKRSGVYDVEGVVLIDEIEAHLHISLQKKILPFLINFFPKVQFIVTTHSPFVLNSVENAVIYDLENHMKVEDLSAYSYEGVVEGYFKADMYSDEAKEKLNRYEQLVMKQGKSDDEVDEMVQLRMYLKQIPEDLAKELVAKFREIELKRKGGQM